MLKLIEISKYLFNRFANDRYYGIKEEKNNKKYMKINLKKLNKGI